MSNPRPEVWERFIAGDGKPGMRARPASVGERLGWETCGTCGGLNEVGEDGKKATRLNPAHSPCPDCFDGYSPPAELVERVASVFQDADHREPFASQYARFVLLEQARWIVDLY